KKGKKQDAKSAGYPDSPDMDEEDQLLDAAVAEVATSSAPGEQDLCGSCVFSMSKAFFSADREQKSLFGKMKMPKGKAQKAEIRKSAVKHRGVHEGHFAHYRRLFLVEPASEENWGRPEGCAEMVPEAGEVLFAVRDTREYEMARAEFAGAAMLHDPNEVNAFLMDHPFCVEALFVLSDICRQSGQHQDAFQLLRRAAYAMECSFHGSFSPFQETRLDFQRGDAATSLHWPRVRLRLKEEESWPGWPWLAVLWAYMLGLATQGLPRTALEVCKLVLAMTLPRDPLHALVHLDFFCLRAQEYSLLVNIAEGFDLPCSLPDKTILRLDCAMPNFAYSTALALHFLKSGGRQATKNTDEGSAISTVSVEDLTQSCWVRQQFQEDGPSRSHVALMRAMLLFPRTLRPILQELSISLVTAPAGSPYSTPWQQLLEKSPFAPHTHKVHQQHSRIQSLVSEAFVHRCAALFRGEGTLRWLHACAGRLTQMCESSLFDQELMQARKSWSEAELGIGEAFSKDYQEFNTLEVEGERKPPAPLERAFNSWVGGSQAPSPGPGPAVPDSEEAQLQRALRLSEALAEASERRRLVEEQDAEFQASLAADRAREAEGEPEAQDVSAGAVAQLEAMGFPKDAAQQALQNAGGDVAEAVSLLTG
ncbi:Tcf25, partial [Symbiodinium sp. CCMP2456]